MLRIIGAGLSGCEAAYVAAKLGVQVELYDMKPNEFTPAHKSKEFAELVCSNSLRSDRLQNAAGLLKEELRQVSSLVMQAADACAVPAGGALAVNRNDFSKFITHAINSNPNIHVICEHVDTIPKSDSKNPVIIATGPLTEGKFLQSIENAMGTSLHFFDAAAPIVTAESIDFMRAFEGSRYDRGSDYINCPMNAEEYFLFVRELTNAQIVPLHGFEDKSVFEGCMPVEVMAKRGEMTLAFGPLKPIGLVDNLGKQPFAVVQLRKEDKDGRLYNMVGFQTNLKFDEQRRVFSLIPGLEHAEFVRLGVMHRNSFIDSPHQLDFTYRSIKHDGLYFAGQITGVEGYLESTASGFVSGLNAALTMQGKPTVDFTRRTALGALAHYVSEYAGHDFQPQNINFGIIDELDTRIRNKQDRYLAISSRALDALNTIKHLRFPERYDII